LFVFISYFSGGVIDVFGPMPAVSGNRAVLPHAATLTDSSTRYRESEKRMNGLLA